MDDRSMNFIPPDPPTGTGQDEQDDADVFRVRGMAAWAQMLDVIEAVEWEVAYAGVRCPWCLGHRNDGHRPDCPRQLAIARVRG